MTLADCPDVLMVPEAARLARVGRNAIYAAIARGDLWAAHCGRSIRVPRLALERFLLGPMAEGSSKAEVA